MKETTIKSLESWATPNKFSHDLLVLPSCWLLRHSVSKSAVSPETNARRHQLWHVNQLKPTKCMRIIEDIQENNDLLHIGSMYRISPYFLCFIFLLYMYEDE